MAQRLSRLSVGPLLEILADTGVLTQAMRLGVSAGMTFIATDPERGLGRHALRSQAYHGSSGAWPIPAPCLRARHIRVSCLPVRCHGAARPRPGVSGGSARDEAGRPVCLQRPGAHPPQPCRRPCANRDGRIVSHQPAAVPGKSPAWVRRQRNGRRRPYIAGFTDAIYTTVELPYAAASARDVAIGYCLGTPLRSEIEARAFGEIERVSRGRRWPLRNALRRRRRSRPPCARMSSRPRDEPRRRHRRRCRRTRLRHRAAARRPRGHNHRAWHPGGEQAASYGNGTLLNPSSIIPMSSPGLWKKVPGYLMRPAGAADHPLVLSAAPAALAEPLRARRIDRSEGRAPSPERCSHCWRTPPRCTANWPRKPGSAI